MGLFDTPPKVVKGYFGGKLHQEFDFSQSKPLDTDWDSILRKTIRSKNRASFTGGFNPGMGLHTSKSSFEILGLDKLSYVSQLKETGRFEW